MINELLQYNLFMAAYIEENRAKHMINMPADVKAEVEEMARERGITTTAAFNIIISYGLDVHRLLESQRNTAVSLVLAGK